MEENVLTWNAIENALYMIEQARRDGRKAYKVQTSENGYCSDHIFVFPRLVGNGDDWEYIYAMNERKDEIEKLKIGESLYFQPIRDDKESKGIITRIL